MEKEVALTLHGAHQGPETMLMRAIDILYWPNIQRSFKRQQICVPWQLNKPANRWEPLLTHEVPAQRFSKVGTDDAAGQHASMTTMYCHKQRDCKCFC